MTAPVQHSFCTKNQTWVNDHMVVPASNIAVILGHGVAVLSIPFEALELVTRIALAIIVCPLAFVKPDKYLKSFVYTPLVGIGNIVKSTLIESSKFLGMLILIAAFVVAFLASCGFCCLCCGTLDFSGNNSSSSSGGPSGGSQPPGGGPPGPGGPGPKRPGDDYYTCSAMRTS